MHLENAEGLTYRAYAIVHTAIVRLEKYTRVKKKKGLGEKIMGVS